MVNIVSNPGFEVNTAGWQPKPNGPSSISRSTAQAHSGSASLLMSCTINQGVYQSLGFIPFGVYRASAWVRHGSASSVFQVRIAITTGGSGNWGQRYSPQTPFSGWHQLITDPVHINAIASTDGVGLYVDVDQPSPTGGSIQVYVDDVVVETVAPGITYLASPPNSATVTTSRPTLQAYVASHLAKTTTQYQIASDSGFTVGVVTYTDTVLREFGTGDVSTYQLGPDEALPPGTYYLRARAVDIYGAEGPWSATRVFNISHPPSIINPVPTGGVNITHGATNRFEWDFFDLNPTDQQTAYQFELQRNDNGSVIFDSGKITSSNEYTDYAISSGLLGVALRWRVKVWDIDDTAGTYSGWNVFSPVLAPSVAFTSPVDDSEVDTGSPTFTWEFSGPAGRTQASWRIVVVNNNTGQTVYNSGTVSGTASSHTVPTAILVNDREYTATITVVDSAGLTVTDSVTFTASFVTPDIPALVVDTTPYDESGYVQLDWAVDDDDSFLMWRVYRRVQGAMDWTLVSEISDTNIKTYRDYLVPSQEMYEYVVAQVADRFGSIVESPPDNVQLVYVQPGGYWLIDPTQPELSARLYSVTADSYNTVRERTEFNVVGRGRHVDIGDTVGKAGTLTAQLRDGQGSTARHKRKYLEGLIDSGRSVYLRNPFGDVWLVSLGDMQIQRVAGVGPSEFVDITLPYSEVF